MRQQLDEINRRRRGMIWRGVAAVVLPPVLLCIPLIVLKACKLLLIPWVWTFAPLLLLLVPFVQAFRAYFAAVRAFRTQRGDSAGSQPDGQTEGAKEPDIRSRGAVRPVHEVHGYCLVLPLCLIWHF